MLEALSSQLQALRLPLEKSCHCAGELRQQGKTEWTLTNFLDYRSSKEFVLSAPPDPVALKARHDAKHVNAATHSPSLGLAHDVLAKLYENYR